MSRTYLLIGGNSGIGLAFASKEVEKGNRVIAYARNAANTGNIAGVDYRNYAALDFNKQVEIPESIDGLMYMPGTIKLKPFHRLALDDFRQEMEINLMGAIHIIQQALPALKKGEDPSVVLFSTVAVQTGMPFHSGIASAKGAIEGLVRSLAAEYAPRIRFNAIAPSLTDTQLAQPLLNNDKKRENSAQRHPLKRIGTPEELAAAASFLLSKDAGWVTGQIIGVDGGMSSVRSI
jgi:NAD(P)-dependent dehydrogenase (short-subunit alcohol dehydrogenase family)